MEKIDAKTLAFVLETTVKEANKMIIRCIERNKGNEKLDLNSDSVEYSKNESCSIELAEKVLNIPLSNAIENIRKSYVRSPITRAYIMKYPATKIVPDKHGKLPLTVSLPEGLKSLLSYDDKTIVLDLWKTTYPGFIEQGGMFRV